MRLSGKWRMAWRVLAFFGIITAFFYLIIVAAMPKYKAVSTPQELISTDLSQDYLCLGASTGTVYPGRLYDSQDFARGHVTAGASDAKFQTYRITLRLKPGVTYGLTGQTATYAQRLYVNGQLLSQVGTVSDTASEFVPRTDLFTVYFTPQTEETELILQHAWFNHRSGAFHKLFLAEEQVIVSMERAQTLCDGVITGTLLAMALFFFGVYLFYSANKGMLWFSLSSLCAAVNYLIYESKQIMVFCPNLNWYVGHKIELLTNLYYFCFIALFAFVALRCKPKRWFTVLSFALLGALSVYYIVAPSTFYTYYTVPVGVLVLLCELFTVIILLCISLREGKLRRLDHLIVCLSPLLTLVVYAIEGVTYFSHILYLRAYAMILLAFSNALVLTIHFSRTKQRLSDAQRRELEIAEEKVLLEKMNRLKSDFMRNIAHEMKTPLTVMSGYAQLTSRQLQRNAVNEETVANLDTIAREAGRLSDMVTRLLDVTYHGVGASGVTRFQPGELLEDAAAVCRPVLLKNGNQLRLDCQSQQNMVANKESLLQVLINLAINSSKHTRNGWVLFRVEDCPEGVAFTVADNGSGIRQSDLPHIFERGYGTDGGNGLGLTICRDIVESIGGIITVVKTDETGTDIRCTIPVREEGTSA